LDKERFEKVAKSYSVSFLLVFSLSLSRGDPKMGTKSLIIAVIGLVLILLGLLGLLSVPDEPACISAPASPFVLFYTINLIVGIMAILGALMVELKEA